MNKLALAQRVFRESGRGGDVPTTSAGAPSDVARIFDAVGDAWLELQLKPHHWKWMKRESDGPIGVGSGYIHSPASLNAAGHGYWRRGELDYAALAYDPMNPDSAWKLNWIEEDRFRGMFLGSAVAPGPPSFWSISRAQELMIGPSPDKTYNIRAEFFIEPELLDNDTDEPSMPTIHHVVLIWMALKTVGIRDSATEVVALADTMLEPAMDSLIERQGQRMSWSPNRL